MAGTCAKVVLVVINTIFLIFGVAILVSGVLLKLAFNKFKDALVNDVGADSDLVDAVNTVSIGVICFGCFIFLVSIMGCVGACCHVRCLLVTYATIIIVLLVGQIAVIALGFIKSGDAKSILNKTLLESLTGYHEAMGKNDRDTDFDVMFSTLDCCGANNFTDFSSNRVKGMNWDPHNQLRKIPITCCRGVDYNNIQDTDFVKFGQCLSKPDPEFAYTEGCYESLLDFIDKHKAIIIGVGVGIFVLEIVLVVTALFLACMRDEKEYLVY